jgi:hypothetical protein
MDVGEIGTLHEALLRRECPPAKCGNKISAKGVVARPAERRIEI